MSSRKSSSSGEGMPQSRYGERTPLRSLDNEIPHLSSRLKSKPQMVSDLAKTTVRDTPFCEPELFKHCPPFPEVIQTSPLPIHATQMASEPGDVTFKSFICAGGEVVISDSSARADDSLIFQEDTASCRETDDANISYSVMELSDCDHKEHPYYIPDGKEHRSVNRAPSLSDIPSSSGVDDQQTAHFFHTDCNEDKQETWNSFVCDGGEGKVSDATSLQNETIPPPMAELHDLSQHSSRNLTDDSDNHVQLCQMQNDDHPNCITGNGITPVNATFVVIPNGIENASEKPANGLNDITYKSFNCTGGEIEISDGSKLIDETVPLPFQNTVSIRDSLNISLESRSVADQDHLDHPYWNCRNDSSPTCNLTMTQEPLPSCSEAAGVEQISLTVPNCQEAAEEPVAFCSVISAGGGAEKSQMSDKSSLLSQDRDTNCQPPVELVATQDPIQNDSEQPKNQLEDNKAMDDIYGCSALLVIAEKTINLEDSAVPGLARSADVSDCSHVTASGEGRVKQQEDCGSQVFPTSGLPESSEAKDSAIGSSSEKPPAENHIEVLRLLSECPSLASGLQLGILSPVVKRASLSLLKAHEDLTQGKCFADDSLFESDKSLVAPVTSDPVGLWAEQMDSPMPRPLFNSTTLGNKAQSVLITEQDGNSGRRLCEVPLPEIEKPEIGNHLIPEGQLQQQLRQMVEYLIIASGKMGASVLPPAASMPPAQGVTPAESHNICVGTSPVKLVDTSLNTSGVFVRKREFSVVDSCTVTDPLLWNLPAGSLEGLPRKELEQRLMSSMIMVEALVQQLASSRAQVCVSAGPAPSELREKLVQTDHTELSQTTMYRDLYTEALSRISELEQGDGSLRNLMQSIQDTRATLDSVSSDTDAALSNMRAIGDFVKEDHQSLVSHYGHMKSLLEKSKDTQTKMMQKVQDVLQQRNQMKNQMEEAFTEKEAALGAIGLLRTHCATEISALENSVGSQQELLVALNQTYPEQVLLNKTCNETLSSASELLSQAMEEHCSLMTELNAARGLLQKTAPTLLMLNEKAAAALRERDEHISERDRAIQEREQFEEELNETHSNLQSAKQEIGDLNLQVTILTSEMGVLRQKLTEKEEERGQLERKATELSANISSTLASYTFLEQALTEETTKLQQSWKDVQQANERADQLEACLGQSEQHVGELSLALAQTEEQLGQLRNVSQSQSLQIQQLQDVCAQLSGVREMNEFLQMENELAREQMVESERMLRTNLQALRERNIQCEDLKADVCKLQLENKNMCEDMENTRSTAAAVELELKERMAQVITEITLLHHTLRGLTNELQAAVSDQNQESQKDKESQLIHKVEGQQPSFVDSIKMALTAEDEDDVNLEMPAGLDTSEPQRGTLFSEMSAFTRIAGLTPKQNMKAGVTEDEEEEQSSVTELLSGLSSTVAELISTLKTVQQRKDAELQEALGTICGLQVEQQAASSKHENEVCELKHQLSRLNNAVEKGNQALQQKTQDEKTLTKLMADVQEAQEILNKHKTDNNELRKEVTELRRALQQSKVEAQFLREELRKAGGPSANPVHYMEDQIQLLKEVERLKSSLQVVELAKTKLLERAKRHQIIHQTNQQKSENELQILNHMINKVRETLLSLPEVLKNCEQLQQLLEYIG
ncbi:unnamed protein product [Menidia menidia]|uniref:(Atlantic silverside) hypothetical protein n=1 Tax=Menidia menidia TaxID=238744 RepID=A0A8S4B339_9TELE|nr:unnamed protein product [Menidia menidia]